MKKYLFTLFTLLNFNAVFGATGEDCKNTLVSQLTATLQSSNINLESKTLSADVTSLLQPKLADTIENNPNCKTIKKDLLPFSGYAFSVPVSDHVFDIELNFTDSLVGNISQQIIPEEMMESVLPWYGILVVKRGSLNSYANNEIPIISTEDMKKNKDVFYPANSDRTLGMHRACTHGNHTAHDKDVVNRAAHITKGEQDSFWKGNDYYVYDGEDVYWGWATAAGEVALAIISLGLSAELEGGVAAANTALTTTKGVSGVVTASRLTKDTSKIAKAVDLAKKAQAGTSAAQKATRADAIKALADAGVTVKSTATANQLKNISKALGAVTIENKTWVSALSTPWKLTQRGVEMIKPKNFASLYGPGVTWGQRIKRGAFGAAGGGIGYELIKAFGYSSATEKLDDDLKFNGFGLLSADDIEGRENEVSHGAWLKFEEGATANEEDALNEALAFAEEFKADMDTVNKEDPQCDVDIYVVQPAVSNPKTMGKREVYYIIQNPGGSLQVEKK